MAGRTNDDEPKKNVTFFNSNVYDVRKMNDLSLEEERKLTRVIKRDESPVKIMLRELKGIPIMEFFDVSTGLLLFSR